VVEKEISAMSHKIVQDIYLDKILTGKQVRDWFDEETLAGLTQSLRESGQQEPIHVLRIDGDRYSLLTGGRRLRAARKAGWTNIAAIVEEGELSKSDLLVRQIIENAQREDLTPLEKAKAIELLKRETGWNGTQIAAKLGFSNGTVTKLLALLSLPEHLQQQLRAGALPATAAYELAGVADATEQDQLAGRVARGELTRDGLTDSIKARKRSTKRNKSARRACHVTMKLEDRQSVVVRAPALDLNVFVTIVEKLLACAKQAQNDGLTLEALLKRLANQRAAANGSTKAA
jgi:ParB family chromosome partitioning protein